MSNHFVDSLVRALTPALILIVFAVARRYLPVKPSQEYARAYSIEQLDARFALKQWLVGISMLLMGGAIVWGIRSILVSLNRLFADIEGPSEFVLLPQTAIWWIVAVMAGITLAWETTLGAWSLIGDRNEVALYDYWTATKAGFDGTRVFRIMVVAIVLPAAILTGLAIPEHDLLRNEEIRARGYGFSHARTYRYSDARRMTIIQGFRTRKGDLIARAGVVLDFSDGRRWSSADIGDFKTTVDPSLASFLQARTGLSPQYADAESDIPAGPGR